MDGGFQTVVKKVRPLHARMPPLPIRVQNLRTKLTYLVNFNEISQRDETSPSSQLPSSVRLNHQPSEGEQIAFFNCRDLYHMSPDSAACQHKLRTRKRQFLALCQLISAHHESAAPPRNFTAEFHGGGLKINLSNWRGVGRAFG